MKFVSYQLKAKAMKPGLQVAVAAYGDYGPGYIPTKAAFAEGGYEVSNRACNVAPESEEMILEVFNKVI